jgi:hypothetical protein
MNLASSPLLSMLDHSTRELFLNQLQMMQLLQRRPVMLMSPYVLTLK